MSELPVHIAFLTLLIPELHVFLELKLEEGTTRKWMRRQEGRQDKFPISLIIFMHI